MTWRIGPDGRHTREPMGQREAAAKLRTLVAAGLVWTGTQHAELAHPVPCTCTLCAAVARRRKACPRMRGLA